MTKKEITQIEQLIQILQIGNIRGCGYTEALYIGAAEFGAIVITDAKEHSKALRRKFSKALTIDLSDSDFPEKLHGLRRPILIDKEVLFKIIGYYQDKIVEAKLQAHSEHMANKTFNVFGSKQVPDGSAFICEGVVGIGRLGPCDDLELLAKGCNLAARNALALDGYKRTDGPFHYGKIGGFGYIFSRIHLNQRG